MGWNPGKIGLSSSSRGVLGPNSGKHVYHWPIGSRFVNANVKQNLGLVNFVPESRVSFAQISFIYRKTAAKAYAKLVWKLALKKWNMNFRLEGSDRENMTTFFRHSFAPGNFPLKRLEKYCSIYFPVRFSGKFL